MFHIICCLLYGLILHGICDCVCCPCCHFFSYLLNRCILYDLDIRRLDALRGTPQLDFCQLFLVKESLALMYQMMQLYQEALLQMMGMCRYKRCSMCYLSYDIVMRIGSKFIHFMFY